MSKKVKFVSGVLAATLVIAACGDDDDGGDASADTDAEASDDTAAEASDDTAGEAPEDTGGDTGDASAGSSGAAGACAADDWDAVVAAAGEEGKVVLYTSHLPNQQENLESAFEAAYPDIDLEIQRVLGELEATLDAERETGASGADVAVNNFPTVPEKYLADGELIAIGGPSAADWAGNEVFVDDSYFTVNYNSLGLAWNTDEVPDGVSTFDDLLAPELAGRVGVPDGSTSAAIIDWWAYVEDNFGGEEFVVELAATDPLVYETAVPLQQAVVVGEVAVAAYAGPWILDEQAAGAPVDFGYPDPAWSAPFYAFGLGWGQNQNAACVLLDFMMTPEGQEALAVNGASALAGVDGLIPLEQTAPSQVAERSPEFAEEYGAKWREIFGR